MSHHPAPVWTCQLWTVSNMKTHRPSSSSEDVAVVDNVESEDTLFKLADDVPVVDSVESKRRTNKLCWGRGSCHVGCRRV